MHFLNAGPSLTKFCTCILQSLYSHMTLCRFTEVLNSKLIRPLLLHRHPGQPVEGIHLFQKPLEQVE